MALKKIKRGAKAVVGGIKDHKKTMGKIDKEAEKKAGKSGSRNLDVKKQQKIRKQMKKEQGVSLKKAVKKRYKESK